MDQEEVTLQILHDSAVRQFYANYVGIDNEDELVRHWQTIRSRLSEVKIKKNTFSPHIVYI